MPIMNKTLPLRLDPVLAFAPLLAMPFILNLRWDALIAPSEEPKWFVLVLLGLVMAITGSWVIFQQCRDTAPAPAGIIKKRGLSVVGIFFLVFFAGLAGGVFHATNPSEGINRLVFWSAGGMVFLATARASRTLPGYDRYLAMALSASAFWLCAHFWYGFFVDFRTPGFDKFIHFSLIGHFNFTADVLIVLIPLLTWVVLTETSRWIKWVAGFSLATSVFMLVISGSLGGMGGLLAGGLLAGGLGLTRRLTGGTRMARSSLKRILGMAMLAALVLMFVGHWVYREMPKEYRDQIFLRGEWSTAPSGQDFAKARALPPLAPFWIAITPYLGSRTPMWAATTGMVAERPWLGFGTGSYLSEYPGFSKRYDLFRDFETLGVSVKTNPHNVLLQIAAENGLPMMMLFAGLYLWLLVGVMRQAWKEPNAFWLCGVWALWAAGLDAQVNHVFFNPASLFMAALGFGLWRGRLPLIQPAVSFSPCRLWRFPITPVLAGLVSLAIASYPLRWVMSEYYVGEAMRLGASNPPVTPRHILSSWETALSWSPGNVLALYGLGVTHLNLGQAQQAETYLQQFLALSPHHSAGLNLLANLQAGSGRLDEAEKNLLEALRLEPDATTIRENLEALRAARAENPPANPDKIR